MSIGQLRSAGITDAEAGRLARAGWLRREHRGVYAIGPAPLLGAGRMWAAVLAYDGEPLSLRSACAVWDLLPWPTGPIDITSRTRRRSTEAVRVHRSRTLTPDDVTRDPVHGLPVTTVARTLSDMSRALTPHRLTRLCHRAEHLQILDVPDPCPPKLRRALDSLAATGPQMTRSELEERFLAIAAGAGLPPPLVNFIVNGFEVDFFWPELGLVVETDGGASHGTPRAVERDRHRDAVHRLAGLEPLRFSSAQVTYEEATVGRLLNTTAATRASARRRS